MTATTTISPELVLPKRRRSLERAEFLANIVTTAIEGGINYWGAVSDYRWWDPDLDGGTALHNEGEPNAYAVVHDQEGGGEDDEGKLVTVEDIARALRLIRESDIKGLTPAERGDIMANDRGNGEPEGDHQDIDAGLADCILQVAMFGEVVYG